METEQREKRACSAEAGALGGRLLIIMPAYNEEQSIPATLDELSALPYDLVVVNDGSADATGDICRARGVTVIDLPFNQGLAGAFQAGMRYAWRHGYDMAIQFDADGQHMAEYVTPMARTLEQGYDIVIGSRFVAGKKSASMRGLGMELLRGIVRLTTGVGITDPTSGMRVYSRDMIALFANSLNFGPEPDTMAYLLRSGATVCELPVSMRRRMAGRSYFGALSSARYMARMFLSILIIQFARPKIRFERREGGRRA